MAGAWKTCGSITSRFRKGAAGFAQETKGGVNDRKSPSRCNCGSAIRRIVRRRGRMGAKGLRRPKNVYRRQPGEHVDPRGSDKRRRAADDGRLQQSCDVRPARKAK